MRMPKLPSRAVVERHGPMVFRVCRRVLTDPNDAEDAVQGDISRPGAESPRNRPERAACQLALRCRVRSAMEVRKNVARRRAREEPVEAIERAESPRDVDRKELSSVIDDELSRLPDAFRASIVLCDLEGKTDKEAATVSRVPVGTVSSRVS